MKRRRRLTPATAKRRITLNLPTDSFLQAERIARARRVNLSTVIFEAVSDGLRIHAAAQRSEEVLCAYKKAFTGFSYDEMSVLDGILVEPATKRRWS
jgi:hypothetical protein